LSFCYEDVYGSGGPTPRVIQLKVCVLVLTPLPIYLRMKAAVTNNWRLSGPQSLAEFCGEKKLSLDVPRGRTGHCPGPNLVRRFNV
jgi:hypothetical protein